MEKILVVVDMQKDFIDGSLGTIEAMEIVSQVVKKIEAYKEKGNKIYFTMDTHTEDYLDTQEGKYLPVNHCIKGTEGWQLEDTIGKLAENLQEVAIEPIIFEKGIFGSESLVQTIKNSIKAENTSIELVGLCTDICVLSNAIMLRSFVPEATIIVDASCCAGVSQVSHKQALEAMKMCQVQIKGE